MTDIGHNNPPTELELLNEKLDLKRPEIDEKMVNLMEKRTELPEEILNDEHAAAYADVIKAHNGTNKNVEALRKDTKSFYIEAGKSIEEFFKPFKIDIDAEKAKLTKKLTAYQTAKAEEEEAKRKILAEEARKRAEEEAANAESEGEIHTAIKAETKADAMEKRANESLGSMGKVASDSGVSASTRSIAKHEITNLAEVDLLTLRPYFDEASLNKAIRAFMKAGGRELEGVRIYKEQVSVVR